MAIENEDELDTELETELDSADETETDEEAPEGDGSAVDGETPDVEAGGGTVKPEPTVEDAIAEALKSLEPKSAEQKAADDAAKAAKDGKVKEGDAAGKDGKTGDGKDGEKPGDKGKKEPDHVNDPIPPQVSERTRERITSLVSTVKELTSVNENQGAIVTAIQETGATPEEFGAMITYMRYVHSDKPNDLEEAYKMLQGGLRTISLKLGRSLPEVDALEGHPDLVEAVRTGQTTAAIAEEVAIGRNRQAATATSQQAMHTAAQQETAAAKEKSDAITELNDIGESLKGSDPLYQQKYAAIVPGLQASFAHIRPSLWRKAFWDAYKAVKVTPRTAPVVTPPAAAKPKGQPLRPAAPAGGGKREAKTLEDAIFGEGFPE